MMKRSSTGDVEAYNKQFHLSLIILMLLTQFGEYAASTEQGKFGEAIASSKKSNFHLSLILL